MEQKKTIDGFDLLKIISATLIVFHHYQQLFQVRFDFINFFGGRIYFGNLVELFFMISGFLTALTPPQHIQAEQKQVEQAELSRTSRNKIKIAGQTGGTEN